MVRFVPVRVLLSPLTLPTVTYGRARMRFVLILGIVVTLAGAYILVRGFSVTRETASVDLGPIDASISERRSVPPWLGGAAVAAGLVMIVAGTGIGTNKRL